MSIDRKDNRGIASINVCAGTMLSGKKIQFITSQLGWPEPV